MHLHPHLIVALCCKCRRTNRRLWRTNRGLYKYRYPWPRPECLCIDVSFML